MTTKPAGKNARMHAARKAKNDEFYTQLSDIEKELKNYRDHFRGKTIFLNCDDPEWSNFWVYFRNNFNFLGIQRVIATHYTGISSDSRGPSYALELVRDHAGGPTDVDNPIRTELSGDGDFRSDEAIEYLKQSDIVVTNPPFSLFREYVAQLIEHDKKFVILGNINGITYKEIWPLIQSGKMWLGASHFNTGMYFRVPEGFEYGPTYKFERSNGHGERVARVAGIGWFTNLDHPQRHQEIPLYKRYEDDPAAYPKYDNYDAIEVSKVKDIPKDYDGAMGVPITFLGKHNPDQFEIMGCSDNGLVPEFIKKAHFKKHNEPFVNGSKRYKRLFIKRK